MRLNRSRSVPAARCFATSNARRFVANTVAHERVCLQRARVELAPPARVSHARLACRSHVRAGTLAPRMSGAARWTGARYYRKRARDSWTTKGETRRTPNVRRRLGAARTRRTRFRFRFPSRQFSAYCGSASRRVASKPSYAPSSRSSGSLSFGQTPVSSLFASFWAEDAASCQTRPRSRRARPTSSVRPSRRAFSETALRKTRRARRFPSTETRLGSARPRRIERRASFVSRPVVRASFRVAAFESRRRGVVPARARPEPTRRAAILQGGQLGRRGPRRGANALRTVQGLHAEGSHRGRMRIIVVAVFVRCKTRRTPERERVLVAEIRSLAEFRVRRIARADFRRHPGQPRAARVVAAERVRLVRPRLLGDVELAVPPRPVVQRGPGPVGNASRRVEGVHLTPVAG